MPNPGFIRRGESPKGKLAGILGSALGEGLGEFTGQYLADKSLQSVLDDEELRDAPISERMGRLETALRPHGKRGESILQKRMEIEKQVEQENISKLIPKLERGEQLTEKEEARLPANIQLEYQKIKEKKVQSEKGERAKGSLVKALQKANVPEDEIQVFSDLYDASSEGGRTEIIKSVNDLMRRGKLGDFNKPTESEEKEQNPYYDFPELKQEEGLTENERVKRYNTRERVNTPIYEDVYKKLAGYEDELRAYERIEQLEDSGKLPQGFGKFNVNPKNGDLIIPAQANEETQLFVKTINDFTVKAKESFPGRVTNFDLQTFLRRLPTLANSPEGRRLITKQMELSTRIANLRQEALKEVYDEYGIGNISNAEAKKIASKIYKEKKVELEERLKNLDGLLDNVDKDSQPQKLYHPKTGKELKIPANEIEEAMKNGALREPPK